MAEAFTTSGESFIPQDNASTNDNRHPYHDPTPPTYFYNYLNLASTQEALGVNLNYTSPSSTEVGTGFADTGDQVWPEFLTDLETILDNGVRVFLYYGDAEYVTLYSHL